ncbi:hypothetical protein [Streptomyces sp. NPDC046939]|uniref:hypothetical protein n=1 Tax=Streptomyces sp. NPDC046939 TaxID=3155376 RepID=UPI0033C6478E
MTTSANAYSLDYFAFSNNSCGVVAFSKYGDVFRFQDACSDGRGVRLQATVPTTSTGTPSTSDPKWTKDYTLGATGLNWDNAFVYNRDFTENACFFMRAGLVDNGSYVSGSYGAWKLACA